MDDIPWTAAVNPKAIKDDATEFLALVGGIIATWTQIETKIGDLYCCCVGAHGIAVNMFHQPLIVSYYSLLSFDARLTMTSVALSEAVAHMPDLISEWTTLANRIDRKYKIRNNVAHFSLYGDARREKGKQISLSPNPPVFGAKRGMKARTPIQYFAADLVSIREDLGKLRQEIDRFDRRVFSRMMESPPRPPISFD